MVGHQEEHLSQSHGESSTLGQEDPQPPQLKKEEEELVVTQGREPLPGLEETVLTVVSVKTEDDEGEPQADNLSAPLSCSDDVSSHSAEEEDWDHPQEHLSNYTDCEGDLRTQTDNKHSECSEKKTDVRQLMSCHEKLPPQSQKRTSTLEQEDPQPRYLKEEEEECWMTQGGEYLPEQEETDLTKFPLTCAFVNNDDHKDKAPESSQLHRSPSEETKARRLSSSSSPQHLTEADGGSRADNFFAPLSDHYCSEDEDMDEIREPLSSNTDCEGDMRTQTDNTHSECSKKKTGKRCFVCSVCAKRFTLRRNLTQHMQVHIGEKPFGCSVCGKKFTRKVTIASHMRTHTGEKPFECSICGGKFAQRSTLNTHKRTHTGEKPFRCLVCGDSFAQRATLNAHLRTHTGEKPFPCSFCGKIFSYKGNMKVHMRTHAAQNTFSCLVCGASFSRKIFLREHMWTHNIE
ncbi:uncharacterized protein [Nerophis lumbriciformis]|uniref:uncharacterized protein isoform X2 n=1 Tax=Nerophis lumbriciformis TaxID=546530 RepID=UPI002ADF82C6|nr:zinc finger protein 316-like isoform X2 [Nerophis lumbriciformis]